MSLQDSTFNTVHVEDNEIVKANDFEFAFEQLVENVSKATQMFMESDQDFVINGEVVPDIGMNVKVSPIYGVCKSTGVPFGRTETSESVGFEGSSSGRIDIIQVKGDWEPYDEQQRAFNDPDTDTQTYQYIYTKRLMKPVYLVKQGIEGSGVAPDLDTGYVKLAEVSIRAGATSILATDIHNITADVVGMNNEDWTNEEDITYNIGSISQVNERFRVQHNADGTHADNSINSDSLNIGTGSKQINGNILPVGGTVSIPNESIASTDSILTVFTKVAAMITSMYNAYLKFGTYGFNGEMKISSVADGSNVLTKPISVSAAGNGTAVIKIDGSAVLSIDANGKLSTNGYTATQNNNIVTKAVTDAISNALSALATRVAALEQSTDVDTYSNGVISSGTNGRYNPDYTSIYAATTQNITLSGSQTIDGQSLVDGLYVLVKDQTDATENGIYEYSDNSAWTRVLDFPDPDSLLGKIFTVTNGLTNAKKMFYLVNGSFSDPDNFGTDNIIFMEYFGTSFAVPNKVILRDNCGRAKVCAPAASDDIARKAEIDALYGNVAGTAEGATAQVGTATTFARSDHVHPYPMHQDYKLIPIKTFLECDLSCVYICKNMAGLPEGFYTTCACCCNGKNSKTTVLEINENFVYEYLTPSITCPEETAVSFARVDNTLELQTSLGSFQQFRCGCDTALNNCVTFCNSFSLESKTYVCICAYLNATGQCCPSPSSPTGCCFYLGPGESCLLKACVRSCTTTSIAGANIIANIYIAKVAPNRLGGDIANRTCLERVIMPYGPDCYTL